MRRGPPSSANTQRRDGWCKEILMVEATQRRVCAHDSILGHIGAREWNEGCGIESLDERGVKLEFDVPQEARTDIRRKAQGRKRRVSTIVKMTLASPTTVRGGLSFHDVGAKVPPLTCGVRIRES
jgi:hypothetical protein